MTLNGISNAYYNPYAAYGSYPGTSQTGMGDQSSDALQGVPAAAGDDQKVKQGYKSSPADCQTCRERKYQDGSDESDVSFKAPGHISPQASAATVMAHERQHVSNAYEKAAKNNGNVLSCNVTLRTAICPECGTSYVSGGTTNTKISYPNESNPYQQNKKAQDAIRYTGANIDYAA